MDNEQYIESGLSVGTMKIANKYEIFTEEEIDAINNKIPELDERVDSIESEVEFERKRIDNLAKLEEGSTTGDAELIDGRIGADGFIYDNIGTAIRSQFNEINGILVNKKDITGQIVKGFVMPNGNLGSGGDYVRTEYIEVTSGKYLFSGRIGNSWGVCGYDKNKNFIKNIFPLETSKTYINKEFEITDENISYICASSLNIGYGLSVVKIETIHDVIDKKIPNTSEIYKEIERINDTIDILDEESYFKENIDMCYYFNTAICIGDSITEGFRKNGIYNFKNNSYPTYLSKFSGWNVTNAGVTGITTVDWWKNEKTKYDFTKYDVCFIMLGHNDDLSSNTVDKDTNNNDYNLYSDTVCGRYCSIIEYIKEKNPNIKICIIEITSMNNQINKWNTQKYIAEKYSLPFLRIHEDTKITLICDLYTEYYPHYNTIGYNMLAKLILKYFCDYVKENLETEFKNYISANVI